MMNRLLTALVAIVMVAATTASVWGQAAPPAAASLLNANTATEADLARLPHLNPALAKTIIGKRPFATFTALDGLLSPALSRVQLTELYGRLFVPVDINIATDADVLLIPNAGNRMVREFKEYRPWVALAQFRREIGKYVNAEEVARLERYIVIK